MSVLDRFLGAPNFDLRGHGVLLRAPQRTDYPQWAELRGRSRLFLQPWEPRWSRDELSRAAFASRLARYSREARERSGYTFFLLDDAGQILYGGLSLGHIRHGVAQSGMIGYWMGEPHAGRGLMARGLELIKSFAFEVKGLHRLEAACLPRNTRSTRLLLRSGFREEGLLRGYLKIADRWEDHLLFSMLAEEWRETGQRSFEETAA